MKPISTLLLVMPLLFAAQPSHAGEWRTDEGSGCQAWIPAPRTGETIAWSGACKDGRANGKGTLQLIQDGDTGTQYTVTCAFQDGKCSGVGGSTWASGHRYDGDFVDGKRTGRGTYIWANGNRYEGNFVENERTGKGTFVWANGDRHEGDFIKGKRTGRGTYAWTNGNRYEGDFIENELTGKGTFIWPNGDRHEGDFVKGKRTGRGTFTWADGSQEEGNYIENKRVGKFLVTWTDGYRYERMYANDASDLQYETIMESCTPVAPAYPAAVSPHTIAQVKARALIVDGTVKAVQIMSGPDAFHSTLREALLKYKCPIVAQPVSFFQEFDFRGCRLMGLFGCPIQK